MYAVSVIFTIDTDFVDAFRELICLHAERTLEREEGCRQFDVGVDLADPTRVFLYEVYENREAFEFHSQQDYLATFFETADSWILEKTAHRWDLVA